MDRHPRVCITRTDAPSSLAYLESVLKVMESKISVPKTAKIPAADAKDAKSKDGKSKPDGKPDTPAAGKDGAASAASKPAASASGDVKMADAKPLTPAAAAAKKEKEITEKAQATAQSAPYIQAATLLRTEIVRRKCEMNQLDAAKVYAYLHHPSMHAAGSYCRVVLCPPAIGAVG